MRITEIHIHPVHLDGGLVAFANLILDDQLALNGIGIYRRKDGSGYRLTYPMKGKGYLFHPITRPLSREFEAVILAEVKTVMESHGDAGHRGP
jgi:DNA-binding cell septation regulator SpoVG